jgi:hypothetical protein
MNVVPGEYMGSQSFVLENTTFIIINCFDPILHICRITRVIQQATDRRIFDTVEDNLIASNYGFKFTSLAS